MIVQITYKPGNNPKDDLIANVSAMHMFRGGMILTVPNGTKIIHIDDTAVITVV